MRTLWCCRFLGKRTGNIRFNVIYEEPFSPCFLFLYLLLQTYARSNPIGGRVFFSCFQFFLSPKMIKRTILHMYVVWFVIHMYASLEKKGSAMKKVFPGTGSYFHSIRQSRVLTTTPWGQRVLGLNLMRQIRL